MKQYDVFISYSRRDIDEANRLCAELDAAGVNYWIDRNIHGSANFLTEITERIRECKVLLFIASHDSANSEWTQKEILYAIKNHKIIVPYRIGEFTFDANPELDFVFMNVQWLENRAEVVRDARELCGIEPPKSESASPYSNMEEQARLKAERNAEMEARLVKEREEFNRKVAEWERKTKLREEQERMERQKKEQTTPQRNTSTKQNENRSGRLKRVAIILALIAAIGYGVNLYKQQAAEKAEQQRIAEEQRIEQEKAEQQRIAEEQRIEQEKAEQARVAQERRVAQAQQAEQARLAEERRIAEDKATAKQKAQDEAEQLKKDVANWTSLGDKAVQEKNYTEAVKWYRKAAEQGDADAQYSLGEYYYCGLEVAQNYAEAVKWWRKAAEQGNTNAQNWLGICYYKGEGVSQDYAEAVKWWCKAAEQGKNWVGFCYYKGKGTSQNYTEAIKWWRKAAEQGDANAQNWLDVVTMEEGKAKEEAERKAEISQLLGEQTSAELLKMEKVLTNWIAEDKATAKKDIANWVKLGDKAAQEKNYTEAVKWYLKAAEQGNTRAQFNLGLQYDKSKNYTEAFIWFKKAAEGGDAFAQNWMGHYYEFGYGVQKNKKTAIEWYKKSAQSGLDTSAKEHLERLGVKY